MRISEQEAEKQITNFLKKSGIVSKDFEIHKLLLEFEFKIYFSLVDHLILGIIKSKYPIQEVLFDYGLKITNIGNKVFPGGWIDNFMISQELPQQTYLCPTDKKNVLSIQPGESKKIMLGKIKNHFCGPITLSCIIRPNNQNHAIETYQKISETDINEACAEQPNKWYFSSYIETRSILFSQNTTRLLLLIALLTVFQIRFNFPDFWSEMLSIFSK
ncbi:MAG: hypothetical protein KKC39_08840 [Candidatus Omnitrophica bacterium]|nr:hypothetical protein [Candidatus Omnitrophota bacterium]MCG2707347.1 hypothetical protein [Candidatus Omnitrophota bacterium]